MAEINDKREGGKSRAVMNIWQQLLQYFPDEEKPKSAKIPAAAILRRPAPVQPKQPAELLPNCCQGPDAFRAGLTVEEAALIFNIKCSEEQAAVCCHKWQLKEKVELYTAQAAAAKAGDVQLLKHLGKAVLLQDGKEKTTDPGLGDIVFYVAEDEKEPGTEETSSPLCTELKDNG